jgi:ectoine hydroxylase-related dioxygenase (phytanoyl-CoA dioxygenase family)
MKCLTNLTDLDGPEDGGTTVIAGSHKVDRTADRAAMVAAALEDPSLIHHVVAPAGSTLVFFESLLHSGGSGETYNGKERVLILASFLPAMYQAWNDYNPYMPFMETLNEDHRQLFTGSRQYGGGRRARDLAAPREHTGWGLGHSVPPQ